MNQLFWCVAGSDPQHEQGDRHGAVRAPAPDAVQPLRAVRRQRLRERHALRPRHARARRRPARHQRGTAPLFRLTLSLSFSLAFV